MRNPNSRGKYLQLQFTVEDKGSSSRQQSITRQASAQPNDRGEARNGQPQVHLVTVIPAVDWHHIDWVHEIECAEAATWTANELVARTLETAVTGREAATTLHHAHSAQVHVARVLDWSKEWTLSQELALPEAPPSRLHDCLAWMRRA